MAKPRIITDATAHLDPDLVAQHQITILPIDIHFGNQKFRIEPDTDPEQLFRQMAGGPAETAKATISTKALQEAYERISAETGEILVILSSSKLSQGFAKARDAVGPFLGRCQITVVDSMTASWGLGLMVEAAAKAADEGQPLDDIVRLVRGILPHIYLVFFVERLDYLERGGRIDPAQALLGTMLRIKPLLLIEDGDIIPLEKVRTQTMAIEKLADFVAEFARIQQVVILSSPLNGRTDKLIGQLREHLSLELPNRKFPVVKYDPILACHLGPEALGVVVYEGI
jgi:DegV family protein with EDD domain